jgi:hypothetical protein
MQTITAAGGRRADGLRTFETHVCFLTSFSHFQEHKHVQKKMKRNEKISFFLKTKEKNDTSAIHDKQRLRA